VLERGGATWALSFHHLLALLLSPRLGFAWLIVWIFGAPATGAAGAGETLLHVVVAAIPASTPSDAIADAVRIARARHLRLRKLAILCENGGYAKQSRNNATHLNLPRAVERI
jgi:hypothetical protein